jgi:uncharacterized YkwD family protein
VRSGIFSNEKGEIIKQKHGGQQMKRIVMVLSLVLLLSACGTQNQQSAPMKSRSQMQSHSKSHSQSLPQMNVSSVDTNLPVNQHVVQGNESLWDIAQRYHVDINELLRLNPNLGQGNIGNPNGNAGNTGNTGNAGNTGNTGNNQTGAPADTQDAPNDKDQTVTLPGDSSLNGIEQQVLALTNQERQKAGLAPCAGNDANLNRSARAKSQDMATNNYFSHNSPTYGDPFAMMRNFGVQYQSAGENIAMGQPTPAEVVKAWMNSPGHRQNIMNGSYTHLGVGYIVQNGKPYWTQQFIGKK